LIQVNGRFLIRKVNLDLMRAEKEAKIHAERAKSAF
jgi:hypothetical protein